MKKPTWGCATCQRDMFGYPYEHVKLIAESEHEAFRVFRCDVCGQHFYWDLSDRMHVLEHGAVSAALKRIANGS